MDDNRMSEKLRLFLRSGMGIYSDYLDQQLSFEELSRQRKLQLQRISELRGRPILAYASDFTKQVPSSIDYSDIVPFSDQVSALYGEDVDIVLETPGGLAEVVEDLVHLLRSKFERVGVIIPGTAKSAGTIFAMAADEILMGTTSALGPIDAQISTQGKTFSADAFLTGLDDIRRGAERDKHLDIALIPILQAISPGEIQHCVNAQAFSRQLVTNWLKEYKFRYWGHHSSSGEPVTEEEKVARAEEIAKELCVHSKWLTHGRSIRIADLRNMRLQITDYTENDELNDAITRYYTLLRMSFETNIYKIYETPTSQIYRSINTGQPPQVPQPLNLPNPLMLDFECPKCKVTSKIQINFDEEFPVPVGVMGFPKDNIFRCPSCGSDSNLLGLRQQLEAQLHRTIV